MDSGAVYGKKVIKDAIMDVSQERNAEKMNTTDGNKRRKHLTDWLLKELGSADKVREFSSSLRLLNILDLRDDDDLEAVTTNGLIDTLVVLYQFGTISKLVEIKTKVKFQKEENE